eukprot:728164-Pelagomonas_calceolata.AAC.2
MYVQASALESELALMRQRMRALVSLASTAAQHKLQHNHKKGSNTGTISGSDAAEQSQEPEAGQQKLHEQQQQQQEQQSDAVLSLLGVLRGMDAAHLQESGVDASLQRVRLLQLLQISIQMGSAAWKGVSPDRHQAAPSKLSAC